MAKLKLPDTAGFNAGRNYFAKSMKISDIVIDSEISQVFSIQEKVFQEIKAKMLKYGYDENEPVVLWKGTNILVDGRTRYTAAKETGFQEIPVTEKEFKDRSEAILYTFERQVVRRNLTGAEIMTAAKMLKDGRKESDGTGRAAELLAEKLGVSAATMYQARALLKEAPAEILQAVENGEMSIAKGYNKVKSRVKPEREKETDFQAEESNENAPAQRADEYRFLKDAVALLIECGQAPAAKLLVNHFLKQCEKRVFYDLLTENIRAQLPRLPLLNQYGK